MTRWRLPWLAAFAAVFAVAACSDPATPFPPEDVAADVDKDAPADGVPLDADDAGLDAPDDRADAGRDAPTDRADARDGAPDADAAGDVIDVADVADAADAAESGMDATPDVAPDVAPDAPRPDGGRSCATNADCDDGVGCTVDTCRGGVCSRVPDYTLCGDTENCDPRAGCQRGRACARDSDCAEPDPCKFDPFCDTSGVCLYDYLDDDFDGEPPVACGGGDCDDSVSSVRPGAAERCDGVDNNCDGRVDEEGATPLCPGGACVGGRCVCMASGLLLCSGRCVDGMSDASNCGRCGNVCPSGRSCVGGVCDCSAGRTSCGGVCVDTLASSTHCGMCGAACRADQSCTAGRCACPAGATECAGRCVVTATDPRNCGACGTACTAPAGAEGACRAGVCGFVCAAGRGDCDGNTANGCETDVLTAAAHCGVCGRACAAGAACAGGACPGDEWARALGASSAATARAVARSAAGDIYLVGTFTGSLSFAGATLTSQGQDGFVAAYDASGTARWARRFGGSSTDSAEGVAVDASGNVFVTGQVTGAADLGGGTSVAGSGGAVFVSSFTPGGAPRWGSRYGSSSLCAGTGVAVDGAGNVYVAATFSGAVDFGGGPVEGGAGAAAVVALTGAGAHRWVLPAAGTSDISSGSLAVDASGSGALALDFYGTATVRSATLRSNGLADAAVVAFDASGAVRWTRAWGGADDDLTFGVALDASGDVYTAGRFYSTRVALDAASLVNADTFGGTSDASLVVLTAAAGAPRVARRFGGEGEDGGVEVSVDVSRNVHFGGWFEGTGDFGGTTLSAPTSYDGFLLLLDVDGNARRARRFGGSGDDEVLAVAGFGGAVLAGGTFSASAPFGATTLTARGTADAFLARLAP